jgi:hypothetical protein
LVQAVLQFLCKAHLRLQPITAGNRNLHHSLQMVGLHRLIHWHVVVPAVMGISEEQQSVATPPVVAVARAEQATEQLVVSV